MDLETLLTFADEAENKLIAIRGGILVCRQEGRTAELEMQLRGIWALKDTAAMLGLDETAAVFETLHHESSRIFASRMPISDDGARVVLDLLAHAEAEVVKVRLALDESPINITDFVDQSFDFLQFDTFSDTVDENAAAEPEPENPEAADDEFEIDAEMLEIFAMEAEDLLGNIETSLDALVAEPGNRDALWEIRRNAHTFKGAAGIVGLKKPSRLAHRIEDMLDHLAQNEIRPDERVLDLLTLSTNCLRNITSGDTSAAAMQRMDQVYRVFDDVMAAVTNPAPPIPEPEPKLVEPTPVEPPATFVRAVVETPAEVPPAPTRPIVRVSIARLDELVRIVSDLVVSRSVIEQRIWEFEQQIEELHSTTRRLQATSAKIETDFEASMLGTQPAISFGREYRPEASGHENVNGGEQFDSLEMDRYTDFHQSARELTEATSDSFSINTALEAVKGSLEIVFEDQRRLIEEMQEKVMQIRLIQFGSLSTRIQRAVRVTCEEENKRADITIENPEVEIDTDLLDSLVEPLMHLLRNAVVHGIEPPDTRRLLGKPESGNITVRVRNEETHVVLQVSDDGRGIAASALKEKAISAGLMDAATAGGLNTSELLDLIFLPGLTTAEKLSMSAGRGVGMSIVKESIESRKGTVSVETVAQRGTTFTVRVPLAFAVAQVLLVRVERQTLAIPLKLVKHISEFGPGDVKQNGHGPALEFEAASFPVRFLADHISVARPMDAAPDYSNTLLIETDDTRCALLVDEILKTEEVAIKPLGRPLENLKGVIGAAVLGSGDIVPILDMQYLLKNQPRENKPETTAPAVRRTKVLVVDDSPSVRHMTSKVITSAGWEVITAKDGLEAFELLQTAADLPDVVLTDVEMPRMDGYELISALKGDPALCDLPIVLITSRSGEKHRERALALGVSDYLAKPYDDSELIGLVKFLSSKGRAADAAPRPGQTEPEFISF